MSIKKALAQSKLALVINQELTAGDQDKNGRISTAELPALNGFLRARAQTGDTALQAIKARAMQDAMAIWAKYNGGDKKVLTDAEIKAIKKDDPQLGALTDKAIALAKGKTQPSDAVVLAALPASHALRKLAEAIDTEWGDANISSSSLHVTSGRIVDFQAIDMTNGVEKREATLRAACVKIFKDTYESEEEEPLTKNKQGLQYGEWQKALPSMMKSVAEDGFDYAPENDDDRDAVEKTLRQLITASGAKYPIVCEVKDKLHSATTDEKENVATFLISDIDSGEYIAIYVRAGSM